MPFTFVRSAMRSAVVSSFRGAGAGVGAVLFVSSAVPVDAASPPVTSDAVSPTAVTSAESTVAAASIPSLPIPFPVNSISLSVPQPLILNISIIPAARSLFPRLLFRIISILPACRRLVIFSRLFLPPEYCYQIFSWSTLPLDRSVPTVFGSLSSCA